MKISWVCPNCNKNIAVIPFKDTNCPECKKLIYWQLNYDGKQENIQLNGEINDK